MTIRDFCAQDQLRLILSHINNREPFEYSRSKKEEGTNVKLSFKGDHIKQDLANEIWHGHDYLVHFSVDYSGKAGYGGWGYATDKFEKFESWELFKDWIDGNLKKFAGYDTDELGQMCLF